MVVTSEEASSKVSEEASLEEQYRSLQEAAGQLGERSPKQCYRCQLWFHYGDEDIIPDEDEKSYDYICVRCLDRMLQ